MRVILVRGGQCRARSNHEAQTLKKEKDSIVLHCPHDNLWPLNRSYSAYQRTKTVETSNKEMIFFVFMALMF